MNRASKVILFVSSIVASAALASAQVVTGNLGTTPQNYGSPLALQTINTSYGDSTIGDGSSAGGSEMDAAYGTIAGGNLYLLLTGNYENNGNYINVFVSSGNPVNQGSTLSVAATGNMNYLNGAQFSSGFAATYAIDINNYASTLYTEEYSYNGTGALQGGYVGSVAANTGGPGAVASGGSYPAYATIAMNDYNVSTMGAEGGAFSGPYATTGLELAIPLSAIGYVGGSVEVLADIVGGNDSQGQYFSNQTLPGQLVGSPNYPTSPNFDAYANEYFTVVPEPSSIALVVVGLLGAIGLIRRRS